VCGKVVAFNISYFDTKQSQTLHKKMLVIGDFDTKQSQKIACLENRQFFCRKMDRIGKNGDHNFTLN
jgi:predicted component of type VI protein secretion system